ncbi:DUF3320 domain-containing protein [Micromonospora polyrhachis]|uniref:AAA domain-containing protein n=1 Tax=Micromonospora polyrhachis TaxID=1282883 RepID=A0A7W7WS80_9ACTN|nr:DUF4011 domain-containing protein [Micromonospora polyrhachis]MBB4961714.1 hypothetical protein [Micromonospora polyrhachis]
MPSTMFEQFTADDGQLAAGLLVQPAVSYALVRNRVPLVRHLSLTNLGQEPLSGMVLTLELSHPGEVLAGPWRRTVTGTLRPGATMGWDYFADLAPDPDRLRLTETAFPLDYRLTVHRAGHPDLRLSAPSLALAHDEWFNRPALYDSLAAFVQPGGRVVAGILETAGQILALRTGSGALQGYQAGPERAANIAGAIYEALRHRGIGIEATAAPFEDNRHRVRDAAAVLTGGTGTCLDLCVTYAACLAAAGLHPLIWITAGHALAGFLLDEERLGSTTVTEPRLLVSMVETGRAVPVELSRLGIGASAVTFPDAVQAGLAHFEHQNGRDLRGVIDVRLAHRSGLRPLPTVDGTLSTDARRTTDATPPQTPAATSAFGGEAIELPQGGARSKLHRSAADRDDAPLQSDASPARMQRWKKSLLDLSLRNPLLNLPTRGRGLELHVPVGALALLDDLIHDGKQLEISPQDAVGHLPDRGDARRAQDLDPEILTRELGTGRRVYGSVAQARYTEAMRELQREARTMEQETGGNYLYLTIGTLVHPKTTGGEALAPLFLLPVRIEGGTGRRPYGIVIDGTEVATPNHCLVEWLRVRHGVRIPELEDPALDERGIDIPRTLAAIKTRLADNQLDYRIDEAAYLRLLQFSTFQMWRDLTDHWSVFLDNPVVRHLVESYGDSFADPALADGEPEVDEARLHLPIPADGSQLRAIVMAEHGQSFILEGPPGSGKSQTIANMIAATVAAGRSVLFVAEKQAALEVAKRRLDQIGLGPFALDLHGRKQSVNAIRQQLQDALDQRETSDENVWASVENAYRNRLVPLTRYPEQVHAENATGRSLWSAYEQLLAYGDGPTAPVPVSYLAAPQAVRSQVEQALRELPTAAHAARLRPEHPWSLSGCRELTGLHVEAVTQIAADLEESRAALAAQPHLMRLLRELPSPEFIRDLAPAAWLAVRGMLPNWDTTQQASSPGWGEAVSRLQTELTQFQHSYEDELTTFRPDLLNVDELEGWHAEAQAAARRFFGGGRRRRALAERLAIYLQPLMVIDPEQIELILARLVAAQAHAHALLQQVAVVGGLWLPADWHPADPAAEVQLYEAVQATQMSRTLLTNHPAAWELFQNSLGEPGAILLDQVAARWRAWQGILRCEAAELVLWTGGSHWLDAWHRDGATWLRDLRTEALFPLHRWADLLARGDVLAAAGLGDYRAQLLTGQVDPEHIEEAYQRGVATASLPERLRVGGLHDFDPDLHDEQIARYESAAHELRTALPQRLSSVLVRRRPFDPTDRRGRFGEFESELRRKRGGKTFRELFETYPDLVLALTPCVLVSPASAATFLAPGAHRFDLVIFDEASQIRVAEAVGAMGRGRAVVIVGDSRQMPPTTVMQAAHGSEEPIEENGPIPEDLESILNEAVESGLPQRWLSWHYRSHDESLIAFSNRYYYDSQLSSLPSPGVDGSAGIHWRRVDGRFDRGASRTNEVEAQAIVAEIGRRLRDPATAGQSIGVVTCNIQQRNLILNLLEESNDPLVRRNLADAAEPVFVKNLENVQGDERDVVLFSLAFSPDPDTGLLPLNFGPLSQAGGERRLNVAITRARRQVVLFASFDPSHIDLARTSAVGTQHLRAYCELAVAGAERLGDLSTARTDRSSRVRDEVAEAIRTRGYEVTTGHGLSDFTVDIAVRTPGAARWQVAVMLDGPEWSRRRTVADRDSAPTLLQSIMGWPQVVRFWLPAWINDRNAMLDRIETAIAAAVSAGSAGAVTAVSAGSATGPLVEPMIEPGGEPVGRAAPATPPTVVATSPADAETSSARVTGTWTRAFVPYLPTVLGGPADVASVVTDQGVQATVRKALWEVLAAEGPIEQHRLVRLTFARFEYTRVRADRRAAVLALIDPELIREHPEIGTFVWPTGVNPLTWPGIRVTQASADRSIGEVPPEEMANALVHVVGAAPVEEVQLLRSALELLGYRRRTEKSDKLLRYALRIAEMSGRIHRTADGRYAAAS